MHLGAEPLRFVYLPHQHASTARGRGQWMATWQEFSTARGRGPLRGGTAA